MNFKRFHESKNLFDISAYSSYTTGISNIVTTSNSITYMAASAFLAIRYFFPLNTTDIFTIQLGSESSKVRFELRYRKNGSNVGDAIVVTIGNSYVIRGSEDVDEIQINISNGTNTGTCTASNIMLNTGSTPEPYEPYSSEVWHDTPHYIHNTATDTLTTLPAVLYPNDNNATVGLKGQMEQNGTGTTTVPSKSVVVQSLETGTNYAKFNIADFPNIAVGDKVTINVSGTNYSLTVKKVDSSYAYIENKEV